MKKLLSITALALVIALSLAFTGCSGAQKDASANFQGSWKMTNVAGATEDDIALMEAFGMNVVLDLNEGKTAVLNMMGEEMSGTWEAKSETECTLTIEGDSVTGNLSGEELTFAIEGEEMTFKKVSAEEAAKAKEAVNIPILAGGRMNDPDIAEAAIRDGKIDAVVMGRAALADPEYPNKVLTGHTERIRPCIACNQGCITRLQQGKQPSCAVNPTAMRELRFAIRPAVQPKKVLIVGGGVAGMEAARVAAMRGHKVSLYEKNEQLGGNLIPGGSHRFKKEVRELNAWYRNELNLLPVEIHAGKAVTAEQVKHMGADVIILAVGSIPIMPNIPGMDDKKVIGCVEAFAHPEKVGQRVIIIGGGLVGCEMALDYAQEGKEVTVVEALPKILSAGIPSPIPNAQMIPDLFEYYHVNVLERHKLSAVENGKAILEYCGQRKELEADSIVIAVGFRPVQAMTQELRKNGSVVYEIGDGQQVSTILHAVWDGYEVGNNI